MSAGAGAAIAADDGLEVSGGVGGIGARVEDMRTAAGLLRDCAHDLRVAALAVGRVLADPGLLGSAVVGPLTFAGVERALGAALGGPTGLVPAAARTEALGAALLTAATAYATAEAGGVRLMRGVDLAVGRYAGRLAALVLLAALPQVVEGALVTRLLPVRATGPRGGPAAADEGAAGGFGPSLAGLLARGGDGTEHLVAAVPGALQGLLAPVPALGTAWGLAADTGWPPRTLPDASALLVTLAGTAGLLREPGRVTTRPAVPRSGAVPGGVGDLAGLVESAYPSGGGASGAVRVTRVDAPGGRRAWVVAIPGTQVWDPRTGGNPLDVTSDVHSLAGRRTAAAATVVDAMRTAGVRPGEPVCLVGHSLGGMVAAGLAGDPGVRARFRVDEVVTLGAPAATYPVPRDVGVLSLEHTDDLVPRLDGVRNPDRGDWVTVRRTLTPPGATPDVLATHDVGGYVRTAALVDASHDPSLVAARARLAPFLATAGATATTVEVTGSRVLP